MCVAGRASPLMENVSSCHVSAESCISLTNTPANVFSSTKVYIICNNGQRHAKHTAIIGKCLTTMFSYSGHRNAEFYLDICLGAHDMRVFSGSEDGNVYIWSLIEA